MNPPTDTPPAPAPLTETEEATLREQLPFDSCNTVNLKLLATLDAARAELARERKIAAETEQDNDRARKRLEAERDAALAALLDAPPWRDLR